MAYYGTNMVLAQAHWVGSGSFDLKSSFGFSSVTQITSSHFRCNFSNTLADDYYVVCGSMSAENAASGSNTGVVRGSNGFHVHTHTTSLVEPIFARGTWAGNGTNGNANLGEHHGICVITN